METVTTVPMSARVSWRMGDDGQVVMLNGARTGGTAPRGCRTARMRRTPYNFQPTTRPRPKDMPAGTTFRLPDGSTLVFLDTHLDDEEARDEAWLVLYYPGDEKGKPCRPAVRCPIDDFLSLVDDDGVEVMPDYAPAIQPRWRYEDDTVWHWDENGNGRYYRRRSRVRA